MVEPKNAIWHVDILREFIDISATKINTFHVVYLVIMSCGAYSTAHYGSTPMSRSILAFSRARTTVTFSELLHVDMVPSSLQEQLAIDTLESVREERDPRDKKDGE